MVDPLQTKSTETKSTGFIAQHEWTLVGLLAILAFVLGCFGYAQTMTFTTSGGEYTWWDPVYASLQLFIFEGPDATAGWPLHLQIARALAPMVLLYTAAVAVLRNLENQTRLYRLLFRRRRFVVVCGIGETGFRIARDYCLNSDKDVVAIDLDPMNSMATELLHLGAIVLFGNAMDPIVLHKARVALAKEVFLCTSDDQVNIASAKAIERVSREVTDGELERMRRIAARHEPSIAGEPASLGLRTYLCVDTPDIYEVFTNHPFFETNSDRFGIHLFSRKETVARQIFEDCAPDLYYRPTNRDGAPLHVLFLGFEALARELIVQTALTAHYPDFRRPLVTVLCREDEKARIARFKHRHPHLHKLVIFRTVYQDPMTVTPDQWESMQVEAPFSVCYVTMREDVEGILSARRLNRMRRLESMPALNFVVCLNQQSFLAEIIDDDFVPIDVDKSLLPEHTPIEYFETLDRTISIEVVVHESLDTLARTLHNNYLDLLRSQGETAAANASMIPWSELPAHKKKANQHAAGHMDVKLRCSGCTVRTADDPVPAVSFPLNENNLDILAQMEHRRWMAEKQLAGYSYGSARDEDRLLHPDLVDWENLGEDDRDKDRNNIRQIPGLLALLGQKVCKQDPSFD